MRYANKTLRSVGLVAGILGVSLGFTSGAVAQKYKDAVSPSSAHSRVVRLSRELSEARHVEDATRHYSASYGASVGRWVALARRVGWEWEDISQLMYIINRESRGNPGATNSSSGAAGLLQFMPQWYTGQWSFPAFDPYNPKVCLTMGYRLHKQQGWTPWAL